VNNDILMGDVRNAYRILVGKPEEKIPRRRPRRRWEDNIRMDLSETGWEMWTGFVSRRAGTNGGLL
jgi:hypothetical protein